MKIINNFNKSLRDVSGIYRIFCIATGDMYIGSATHFGSRCSTHIKQLQENKHHSIILQRAYNKYGSNNFIIELVLICSPKFLLYYEQQLINELIPKYNVSKIAGSNRGIKWSEESKRKLSAQRLGISRPELRGKKRSFITRLKISNSRKGKNIGAQNGFYNKTHTQEVKDRLREFRLGKTHTLETREKMSKTRSIKITINNITYTSIQQAALELNIPKTTLWRWYKKGKL